MQTIIDIQPDQLIAQVRQYRDKGFRLVQICCTKLPETLELHYSFDLAFQFVSLRITIPNASVVIPSVSGVYWNAFLYENEIHDLFGINVTGIAVDYQGSFYRTAVKSPFNPPPSGENT